MSLAIRRNSEIGIKNLCLFVSGELHAFLLYSPLSDPSHIAVHNARINYDINGLFDYMAYAFSRTLSEDGIKYANLHSDLNLMQLRTLKLALRPSSYVRKFNIEPAN